MNRYCFDWQDNAGYEEIEAMNMEKANEKSIANSSIGRKKVRNFNFKAPIFNKSASVCGCQSRRVSL